MLKPFKRERFFLFLILMITVLGFASLLDARVGGGHGYSGGGGSGGGSGGGGGDGLIFLVHLIIRYPKIGIPIAVIVIIVYFRSKSKNPQPQNPYTSLKSPITMLPLNSNMRDASVNQLQKEDPNFSLPLFLDFAHLLYTNIFQFAGRHQLDKMKVYLDPSIHEKMEKNCQGIQEIRDIIIGSCSIVGIHLNDPDENLIALTYESNYTVKSAATANREASYYTYYEHSKWVLARKKGVISKGPGEMNRIGCPQCGGSLDDSPEGKCSYCGHEFHNGVITWYVKSITLLNQTLKSPDLSGGYAVEKGTQLPTLYQPGFQQRFVDFKSKYPDFNESAFTERVIYIFKTLQQAWTSQKWELARPYETDHLFQSHLYWINLYKKEQVRNVLKDIQVSKVQVVKLQDDAFYDALTVRIYASIIDYTETLSGNLMGGDPRRPRAFTEYWTFIRRSGIKETEKKTDQCPNCGNNLKIGMVGKCEYCGSKITTGEFDWVLSMIEQDDSYTG